MQKETRSEGGQPCCQPRPSQEPPVRRWPNSIPAAARVQEPEALFHYIRCALSYQNQQLADIKALLQQITVQTEDRRA